MLNSVLGVLAERRWFDTAVPYQMSVHLTQGACVWLLLSREGVVDTHVKFSNCLSLENEALRCAAAHARYPSLAPQFVGHARSGDLELLVNRAVDYRGVDRSHLLSSAARRGMARDVEAYFKAMAQDTPPIGVGALSNASLVPTLQGYFSSHPLAPLAQRWLADGLPQCLSGLPAMPQHADLVLNNLGRTKADRLVIFDWEDFGAVSLPGLDLFTLELALCAADASCLLASRSGRASALDALVQSCCAAMQLGVVDYQRLAPLYALVFRYLKRNYGPAVRVRTDQLLQELAAAY